LLEVVEQEEKFLVAQRAGDRLGELLVGDLLNSELPCDCGGDERRML
jgi:hypothetical protein